MLELTPYELIQEECFKLLESKIGFFEESDTFTVKTFSISFKEIERSKFEDLIDIGYTVKGYKKYIGELTDSYKEIPIQGGWDIQITCPEGFVYSDRDQTLKVFRLHIVTCRYLSSIAEHDYLNQLKSGVYLLQMEAKDKTLIKIGKSENVFERFKSIQTGNPIAKFVGYLSTENYDELEKHLHLQFKDLKYRGEWFIQDSKITEYFTTHPNWNQLDL